jgi:hypothetical protein
MVPERRRPPDRPLQDCPGAQGLYPLGTLARTLWRRNPAEPDYIATSAWVSGDRTSPKAPNLRQHSGPTLGSRPADDANQGPSARRRFPSYRGLGAPQHCPLGMALLATFPTRSRMSVTQEYSFPAASRGSEAPGPTCQLLKPTSFTAKKTPEGPPGGGRYKPTQLDMQSVRTEQSDDAQGFFGSTTPPRSTTRCCKALLDSSACRP